MSKFLAVISIKKSVIMSQENKSPSGDVKNPEAISLLSYLGIDNERDGSREG